MSAGPAPTLGQVLQAAFAEGGLKLPRRHWHILNALAACRTAALGGQLYRCERCGRDHFVPHSCGNRHCPQCQGAQAAAWLERQESTLLPIPYFHVVFTLPHVLNPLIRQNQQALFNLLFATASQTVLQFGRQELAAQVGVTAVLHTWGQTLGEHYHLHCIVTGGGLRLDGAGWAGVSRHYLFPVKALSLVFAGKFRAGLEALCEQGKLEYHGQAQALAAPGNWAALMFDLRQSKWNVYAKPPFGGPAQVLAYLSHYTHRVAISPHRLLALEGGTVTFSYRDYADGQRRKTMQLSVREFVRRFCLHLLPERFVKIRHYGLLGNRNRKARVEQARQSLGVSQAAAAELAPSTVQPAEPLRCPHCGAPALQSGPRSAAPTCSRRSGDHRHLMNQTTTHSGPDGCKPTAPLSPQGFYLCSPETGGAAVHSPRWKAIGSGIGAGQRDERLTPRVCGSGLSRRHQRLAAYSSL